MTEYTFSSDADFGDSTSQVRLYTIEADVTNGVTPDSLGLLTEQCVASLSGLLTREEAGTRPAVRATRQAYAPGCRDAAELSPSAENLTLQAVEGGNLITENAITDVVNLASLRSGYSIVCLDADKVSGHALRFSQDASKGIPAIYDTTDLLGWPTSVAPRAAVSLTTTRVLIVIFCFGEEEPPKQTVDYIADLLSEYVQASNLSTNIFRL